MSTNDWIKQYWPGVPPATVIGGSGSAGSIGATGGSMTATQMQMQAMMSRQQALAQNMGTVGGQGLYNMAQGVSAQQQEPLYRVELEVYENQTDFRTYIRAVGGHDTKGAFATSSFPVDVDYSIEDAVAWGLDHDRPDAAAMEILLRLAARSAGIKYGELDRIAPLLHDTPKGERLLQWARADGRSFWLGVLTSAGRWGKPPHHGGMVTDRIANRLRSEIPHFIFFAPAANMHTPTFSEEFSPSVPPLLKLSGASDGGLFGTNPTRIARVEYAPVEPSFNRPEWAEKYGIVGCTDDIRLAGAPATLVGVSPMHVAFYARLVYSAVVADKSLPESWPMLQLVGYDGVHAAVQKLGDGFYAQAVPKNVIRHLMFADTMWARQWRELLTTALAGDPVTAVPTDHRWIYLPHEFGNTLERNKHRMAPLLYVLDNIGGGGKTIAEVRKYSKFWDEATPSCTNWPAMK